MKTLIITFVALLLNLSLTATELTVMINAKGDVKFIVRTNNALVTVDENGKILNLKGQDINIERYSDFHKHEAGKIKTIAGIPFAYHSNFHSYNSGKLKLIDGKNIEYYSDFHDYEAGKIKSVNNVEIKYFSAFNSYEAGKVKSIGRQKYKYFSSFHDDTQGQLQSGNLKFSEAQVNFIFQLK